MRLFTSAFVMLSSCVSLGAFACESPERFQFPDEAVIQEPDRLTVKVDMRNYVAATVEYVSCIQSEYESIGKGDSDSQELTHLAELNNDAVGELEAVYELFVSQIGPIEELTAMEPENCIETGRGTSPRVLDSRNLVFYSRDGDIYRNVLARECGILRKNSSGLSFQRIGEGGLRAGRQHMQQTVCNGSGVMVQQGRGAELSDCRLGLFYRITPTEAEELLRE